MLAALHPVAHPSSGSLVAIASSAGGVEALSSFLGYLPREFPSPVLIAHHLPRNRNSRLREILQRKSPLPVDWGESGLRTGPGVYLAPPGDYMVIEPENRLRIFPAAAGQRSLGVGNLLFDSVALQFGDRAIAIVLTGCLADGATGAGAVRRNGGRVFVQAPADCEHSDMPMATMLTGTVDFALPLKTLAAAVTAILMNSGVAELFRVADSYRLLMANAARIEMER